MPGPWTPTSAIGHAVYAAGFKYDPDQDIIYSRMDALQRNFGYAYGYDAVALATSFVIDCEPIFFDYAGKHWMIELWKGQYGLETGCEVGVYTRPIGSMSPAYALLDATVGGRPGDGVSSHNLFYDCAADADRLMISATLRRDGVEVFTRGPELHWWLTGFKWGVLSDPAQLSVDVSITLKDAAMRGAFLAAIAGRSYPNLVVSGTTVSFTFDRPYAVPQPPRPAAALAAVESANQTLVDAYNALGLPTNDPNGVDAAFLTVTGLGILNLADQFGRTTAQLAIELGEAAPAIVTGLTVGFGIAARAVERWLNGVPQAFSNWVADIEAYLGLPLDFSCYVMIDNTAGNSDLLLTASSAESGSYVVDAPARIPQGAIGRFVIQDPKPSVFGSKGTATYSYCDETLTMMSVVFSYEDPFVGANHAASSATEWQCLAMSSNPNGSWSPQVPAQGHPLYVAYVIAGDEPNEGTRRRVTRTRKDSHGRVTHLCGRPGAAWSPIAVADAITQIRRGAVIYFTATGSDEATVQVVDDADGPYLRTTPDASRSNNLDALPDC